MVRDVIYSWIKLNRGRLQGQLQLKQMVVLFNGCRPVLKTERDYWVRGSVIPGSLRLLEQK